MNERRPEVTETASSTPAKKSGYIVSPSTDKGEDAALFDVVVNRDAYGTSTQYVPAAEMSSALAGDEFWAATAKSAIKALAETRSTFTADDLHEAGLPEPLNRNSYGAALSAAANTGLITCVGYRRSRRKEAHSRIVSVWTRAR